MKDLYDRTCNTAEMLLVHFEPTLCIKKKPKPSHPLCVTHAHSQICTYAQTHADNTYTPTHACTHGKRTMHKDEAIWTPMTPPCEHNWNQSLHR